MLWSSGTSSNDDGAPCGWELNGRDVFMCLNISNDTLQPSSERIIWKWRIMPTVWFIADLHFDHLLVARKRGFDTSEQHDQHLIRTINKRVRETDLLYILGDVAPGPSAFPRVALSLSRLNGSKHLFVGNHDSHPAHGRPNARRFAQMTDIFDTIQERGSVKYEGQTAFISHFPYDGDGPHSDGERYTEWRFKDLGRPLIHGHTHSTERISWSRMSTPQVCVSWEAWENVVPIHEVFQQLSSERR